MKRLRDLLLGLAASAVVLGAVGLSPASAQDKSKEAAAAPAAKSGEPRAVQKVLIDNDKVRVFEITFRPGEQSAPNVKRPARVVRALAGGTLTVVYVDGKTEQRTFKTGEVKYFDAETVANTLRNDGKRYPITFAHACTGHAALDSKFAAGARCDPPVGGRSVPLSTG